MELLEVLEEKISHLGYLFYLVSPKASSFQTVESVPDYITQVIPYFISLIVIEQIIAFYKGFALIRVNDAIASLSQGIFMELTKAFSKSLALIYYIHIYQNWRICSLQWDSTQTWLFTFIIVDFGYYWIHRATHEINILWGAHQVHHSSTEYNLTTAIRQSVIHLLFQYILYLPLALVIPPSVFLVHNQLNVLYQFWIHTGVVKTIGPLEYIINTPSHHRVHHGRNRYCIDKNYAGVLIIWDRIFGTFEPERHYISYGLTKNIDTFDPLTIQMHHYVNIYERFIATEGFRNKLSVLFKGPGWEPGKPRLGIYEDIPELENELMVKYDPYIPVFYKIYIVIHFAVILLFHTQLMTTIDLLPLYKIYLSSLFIFVSLTSFGFIMDNRKWSKFFEIIRCFAFIIIQNTFMNAFVNSTSYKLVLIIKSIFFISILVVWFDIITNFYKLIYARKKNK